MPFDLSIDRLHAVCRVPADHPDPEAVRSRVERIARSRLGPALERALGEARGGEDPLVYVRRIALDLVADAGALDDGALADALAREILAATRRALAAPSPDVVWFAGVAELHARYVVDVVDGHADGRWYYEDLDGLQHLPTGRRIAEAVVRSAEHAVEVVELLGRWGTIERIAAAMDVAGARHVWRALRTELPPADPRTSLAQWLDADLVAAFVDSVAQVSWPASDPRRHLCVFARLARSRASRAGLPEAVEIVAALLEAVEEDAGAVVDAVLGGRLGALVARLRRVPGGEARIAGLPAIVAALRAHPESVASLAEVARASRGLGSSTRRRRTDHGGAFLLVPGLVEMAPLAPDPGVRLELLARAFGPAAPAVRSDDTARWLAGCEARTVQRSGAAFRAALEDTRRGVLRSLCEAGRIGGDALVVSHVETEQHGGHLVARDVLDDVWLDVEPFDPADECPRAAEERLLQRLRTELGLSPALVVRGSTDVGSLDGLTAERVRRHLASARPAAQDFVWLGLGEGDRGAVSAGLLAHALVRAFTRRLLGFGWSQLSHVFPNLLAMSAGVVDGPDGLEVTLSRVPLSLLLDTAGFDGRRVEVPWLGRPLLLWTR